MQCILGFKSSFPRVKRDKTAAWGEGEKTRQERDQHEAQQRASPAFIRLASPVDTGRRSANVKDRTSKLLGLFQRLKTGVSKGGTDGKDA